jgi:hypothetical protein
MRHALDRVGEPVAAEHEVERLREGAALQLDRRRRAGRNGAQALEREPGLARDGAQDLLERRAVAQHRPQRPVASLDARDRHQRREVRVGLARSRGRTRGEREHERERAQRLRIGSHAGGGLPEA